MQKTKKKSRLKGFFKGLLYFIITFIILLYGGVFLGHKVFFPLPTSSHATVKPISNAQFDLGAASKKQPQTIPEYIKVLAQQVKSYNQKISDLWPQNKLVNQYVIAQDIKTKKIWLISPTGQTSAMSKAEFKKYHVATFAANGAWSPFSANGISGAYLAVDSEALNNYYGFQRYEHLGTYDPFITYAHELFHSLQQDDWQASKYHPTATGDDEERDSDTKARTKRMLLIQQLALAISDSKNQEQHLKDAVATYNDYKVKNTTDFKASFDADRMEGTAYYYELKASLYAGYPSQIKNDQDVQAAISLLLKNDNPAYRASGAISEGYNVGGYAGILLDRLAISNGESPDKWKAELKSDGASSPMSILAAKFATNTLPQPQKSPSKHELKTWLAGAEKIQQRGSKVANIFNGIYSILF